MLLADLNAAVEKHNQEPTHPGQKLEKRHSYEDKRLARVAQRALIAPRILLADLAALAGGV